MPALWWKTGYFEVHHENSEESERFLCWLGGKVIRCETAALAKAVVFGKSVGRVTGEASVAMAGVVDGWGG